MAVTLPEGHGASLLIQKFVKNQSPCGKLVQTAAEDAFQRLLFPAVERETRKALTEQAATAAIGVFASNLRQLLMAAPLKNRIVLGVDPAIAPAASWQWWTKPARYWTPAWHISPSARELHWNGKRT